MEVLKDNVMKKHKITDVSLVEARRQVEQNRHNSLTTTYYLTLKRWIRQGNKSIADITKYNADIISQLLREEQVAKLAQASANSLALR